MSNECGREVTYGEAMTRNRVEAPRGRGGGGFIHRYQEVPCISLGIQDIEKCFEYSLRISPISIFDTINSYLGRSHPTHFGIIDGKR